MNVRQTARYQAIVDLYAPSAPKSTGAGKRALSQAYGSTPAYTGIKCAYAPTPNQTYEGTVGRTMRQQVFTLDRFNFSADGSENDPIELADGWIIKLTGWVNGSTQDVGKTWKCLGNPQPSIGSSIRQATYKHVLARDGIDDVEL